MTTAPAQHQQHQQHQQHDTMGSSQQEGVDFKTPTMDELLRISIKLSDSERMHEAALKETGEFNVSPEDAAWLKEAMGMTQKSDAERMKESLAVLNDEAETQSHKEYALDLILFAIEDIDNACDFVKLRPLDTDADAAANGLPTLLRLLEDGENPTMRLGAAWLLGTLMQNNPKAQAAVLEASADLANKLAALTMSDPEIEVRRKALLALSSLARNSEAGQAAFLAAGGATLPAQLLGEPSPDSALTKRGLFLAAHLVGEAPEQFAAPFSEAGVAPLCCGLIGASGGDWDGEDLDLREQALRLLLALATAAPEPLQAETGDALSEAVASRASEIGSLEGDEKEWRMTELEIGAELLAALA